MISGNMLKTQLIIKNTNRLTNLIMHGEPVFVVFTTNKSSIPQMLVFTSIVCLIDMKLSIFLGISNLVCKKRSSIYK